MLTYPLKREKQQVLAHLLDLNGKTVPISLVNAQIFSPAEIEKFYAMAKEIITPENFPDEAQPRIGLAIKGIGMTETYQRIRNFFDLFTLGMSYAAMKHNIEPCKDIKVIPEAEIRGERLTTACFYSTGTKRVNITPGFILLRIFGKEKATKRRAVVSREEHGKFTDNQLAFLAGYEEECHFQQHQMRPQEFMDEAMRVDRGEIQPEDAWYEREVADEYPSIRSFLGISKPKVYSFGEKIGKFP